MSFAEKDYTHGVDLVTITDDHRPKVEQLVYTPQHQLVVLPDDKEALTPAKLKRVINKVLPDRTEGRIDASAPYVMLKVAQKKFSSDEIHELEELVSQKNAILCGIQKFLPQINANDTQQPVLKSIDDILNSDPMPILQQTFQTQKGHELNERQKSMLNEIIQNIKNETND